MQSATLVHGVPFRQDPRNGQLRVFDEAAQKDLKKLNIKLPTGYGKTFTAAGVYAIRQKHFNINRLLFITPTTAQHEAFENDGHHDLALAGVTGPHKVVDVRYFGTQALHKHRRNEAQVYAMTIQAMCASGGFDLVSSLMETGRWMVVVDEYHHYGIDKTWGNRVTALNHEFLLAMSATPYRPKEDSVFGMPAVEVDYRTAVKENAVKSLTGHAYIYKIDAIDKDGDVHSMTTSELVDEVGSDDPEKIEKFRIERKMRWSPKYVSPLVSIPIERMLSDRLHTGYKLQAIVGAMCVSHAELVCDQLRSLFPELAIDWVGTGTNGRSDAENKAILQKFCPPKEEILGKIRRGAPTLDVLVHVGMAGEGLDTCNVSEIVHLNKAKMNNSNNQENGRAARWLDGVTGHINYDSSSDYAAYVGAQIMDAMDFLPPSQDEDEDDDEEAQDRDIKPLPEEPAIQIFDMELVDIDSGGPEMKRMVAVLRELGHTKRTLDEMIADDDPKDIDNVKEIFRRMRKSEAEEYNEKSVVEQWKDAVSQALTTVTGRVVRLTINGQRMERSMVGDIKKRINQRKKAVCGQIDNNVPVLRQHYQWLRNLDQTILDEGIPSWLQ